MPKDAEEILVKSVIFTEDSQNPNEIENVALSTNSSKPDSENMASKPSGEGGPNEEEIKQEDYSFSLDYNAQDRFGNANSAVKFPDFGNISFPISETVDSTGGFSLSAWVKMDPESIENTSKEIRLIMLRAGFSINIRWARDSGYSARFMCGGDLKVFGDALLALDATKWNLLELKVRNNKVTFIANNNEDSSIRMNVENCSEPFTISDLHIGPNNSQTFYGSIDEVTFKQLHKN